MGNGLQLKQLHRRTARWQDIWCRWDKSAYSSGRRSWRWATGCVGGGCAVSTESPRWQANLREWAHRNKQGVGRAEVEPWKFFCGCSNSLLYVDVKWQCKVQGGWLWTSSAYQQNSRTVKKGTTGSTLWDLGWYGREKLKWAKNREFAQPVTCALWKLLKAYNHREMSHSNPRLWEDPMGRPTPMTMTCR